MNSMSTDAGIDIPKATLPITVDPGLRLSDKAAQELGESLSGQYCFAEPFPHIVIDDFLPPDVVQLALEEFPKQGLASDVNFELGYAGQFKRQILPEDCTARARSLFHFFNSAPVLQFLESLTGIKGLLPDPYFRGGGYHETARGGYLGVHADFRIHEPLRLHRRINMIVYLNERWQEEWRGQLELWDKKMEHNCRSVNPVFNRCVIFNTDADSFHGHPDPLECPDDVRRRSIALYYYTASDAIFSEVPANGTVYHARPGDDVATHKQARSMRMNEHIAQWVPPVLQRYVYAIKRRIDRQAR
jgi:hypothetical protein